MNEITHNLSRTTAAGRVPAAASPVSRASEEAAAAPSVRERLDQVELSEHARLLSRLQETPEVREALVSRVRGEIADGTYLTADKVDAATDNLASDLDELV